MALENWQSRGFGLYVHWPFCESKCPYCDFNSHVVSDVNQDDWAAAFEHEIDRIAAHTPDRMLTSIFFGGGTPSLMRAATVDRILSKARAAWTFSNEIEITLEANPSSVEAARFAAFRDAGVNRISIGIQALNAKDLTQLGRLHSVDEALSALEIAAAHFDRFSFDLIYARQEQTLNAWQDELTTCLSFEPSHVSLYQLTIEDGTAFGKRHRSGNLKGLPDEDLAADMFDLTQEMTTKAGLPAYEISNHARPGHASSHNQIYWNGGDWAGIGPGAHGRLVLKDQRIATTTPLMPGNWLDNALGSGATTFETLQNPDWALEYLMMSLRTVNGCDLAHLASLDPVLAQQVRARFAEGDLPLETDNNRLYIGENGRILLNAILAQLVRDNARHN